MTQSECASEALTQAYRKPIQLLLRDAAKAILLRTPFYRTFHPGQLDAYIDHGLVPLEGSNSPKVTLSIPRVLEAIVYSSQMAGEIWDRLYHGGKTGAKCKEVRFMFAGEGAV